MSNTVTEEEMAANIGDFLNRVERDRERLIMMRGGVPIVEIRPIRRGLKHSELVKLLASGPHLAPEDVEDLARDIYSGRQ